MSITTYTLYKKCIALLLFVIAFGALLLPTNQILIFIALFIYIPIWLIVLLLYITEHNYWSYIHEILVLIASFILFVAMRNRISEIHISAGFKFVIITIFWCLVSAVAIAFLLRHSDEQT